MIRIRVANTKKEIVFFIVQILKDDNIKTGVAEKQEAGFKMETITNSGTELAQVEMERSQK